MELLGKAFRAVKWLPRYGWQRLTRRPLSQRGEHLIIAVADHFEPGFVPGVPGGFADQQEQERRLERWCREYPKALGSWRDTDGQPFRHTYFYPAEQYDKGLIDRLADHCQSGWGEIEVHLHHGVEAPDTAENVRRTLLDFTNRLAGHGCLAQWGGQGPPLYAFIHGNWALANSAGGRFCGVDEEMQILAETGCYADLTLPSAPHPAQVGKINALYECALPLSTRAPHRKGRNLRVGQAPQTFPLIVQGPLAMSFAPRCGGWVLPYIENGALTGRLPPNIGRFRLWRDVGISVRGRPDWIFVKLHCHGMDPRDEAAMFGEPMRCFLKQLTEGTRANGHYRLHLVTAREMVNIILAACDGREGNPGDYRDYRLKQLRTPYGPIGTRLPRSSAS